MKGAREGGRGSCWSGNGRIEGGGGSGSHANKGQSESGVGWIGG